MSELGLIEMTRQRVRASHYQNMTESCPVCAGTGRVFTPETHDAALRALGAAHGGDGKKDSLIVKVHPDVALYVLENEHDLVQKLEKSARLLARPARRSAPQAGRVQAGGEGRRSGT